MLNPKSYTQILASLRFSRIFASPVLSYNIGTQKPNSPADRPRRTTRPTQRIIENLSHESNKYLDKTSKATKSFRTQKSHSPNFETQENRNKKLSDFINVQESKKGQPIIKPKRKFNKEVDPQTLYYNARKKHFEDPQRQENYFKEEKPQAQFLDEEGCQKKLYTCKTVEQILRLYHGLKFSFSTRNLVTTMHRLGKFLPVERKQHRKANENLKVKKAFPYKPGEKRIQSLLFALEEARPDFDPTDKILIIWAMTRLKYNEMDLYVKLCEDLFKDLDKLKSDHLSLLAWCLSKIGSRNPNFYGLISLEIEKRLKKMKQEGCLMTQEAYVKQENIVVRRKGIIETSEKTLRSDEELSEDEDLLESEFEEEDEGVDELELQQKAAEKNTLSAQELKIDELMSAQGISLIIWSFAKRNIQDETLFDTLRDIFIKDIQFFSVQQISNILYGFVSTGQTLKPKDLKVIEKRLAEADLSQEKSLTLKTILIQMSKLDLQDQAVFKRYVNEFLKQNKASISPRFTCEILRVLVDSNILDESFLAQLNTFILKSIRHFNLEDCMSAFESLIRLHKMSGKEIKTEGYSFRTTLDVVVTRMLPFQTDLTNKHKAILRKLLKEGKYNHKDIENLLS